MHLIAYAEAFKGQTTVLLYNFYKELNFYMCVSCEQE